MAEAQRRSFNREEYDKAYAVYSDIVSGRDPDRKDASIVYDIQSGTYYVHWLPKK